MVWAPSSRIFEVTSLGSGPYPTTSPKHTICSQLPWAAARAAFRAVALPCKSLRTRIRISRNIQKEQLSIDEVIGNAQNEALRPIGCGTQSPQAWQSIRNA